MNVRRSTHQTLSDQRGQVLPWVAFMMVLFLGIGAFVLDIGHAYMSYRQLQAATDAAACGGREGHLFFCLLFQQLQTLPQPPEAVTPTPLCRMSPWLPAGQSLSA